MLLEPQRTGAASPCTSSGSTSLPSEEPRTLNRVTDELARVLRRQDGLLTRAQALSVLTRAAVRHRLTREWTRLLPGVYGAFTGTPTARQWLRAALLHCGPGSMLADTSALQHIYGVRNLPPDRHVYVIVRNERKIRSLGPVVVRRTRHLPYPRNYDGLAVAPPEHALVDFALRCENLRTARAVVADAVQRAVVWPPALLAALAEAGPRRGRAGRAAIADIAAGARSAPEAEFAALVSRSHVLPPPLLNCRLRLPDGRVVCPDALFPTAGLVHETNGRGPHAAEDRFEDMQERHDAMTAAGLTVLHNSPARLRRVPLAVIAEVERCYVRLDGRGLPPGVSVISRAT